MNNTNVSMNSAMADAKASARIAEPEAGRADASASKQGPMDNMPPPSSHSRCSLVSEDTAVISLFVQWRNESELLERLAALQSRACELLRKREERHATTSAQNPEKVTTIAQNPDSLFGTQEDEEETASIQLNDGEPWEMLSYSWGGKGRGNMRYDYALVLGGVGIGIRKQWHDNIPNVKVEVGSIPLAQLGGLGEAWKYIQETIDSLGGDILSHILSRVDMYTDMMDVAVDEFCERFDDGRRVCRARKAGDFGDMFPESAAVYRNGRRYGGFTLGGDIKLRVYDKIMEMASDPVKQEVFDNKYGELPGVLTRIEFQLRRAATHEFEAVGEGPIDTVEQYLKARPQIWRYLTQDWFRMTQDHFDHKNKNHQRAKTWTVWTEIERAVDGQEKGERVKRVERVGPVYLKTHVRQAASLLIKAAIFSGQEVYNHDDFLCVVRDLAGRHVEEVEYTELSERYKKERKARITERPIRKG